MATTGRERPVTETIEVSAEDLIAVVEREKSGDGGIESESELPSEMSVVVTTPTGLLRTGAARDAGAGPGAPILAARPLVWVAAVVAVVTVAALVALC